MAASRDPYHTWLGIPPAQQPPNYYRLLGVEEFESRPEVIEAAAERQTARLLRLAAEARGPEVQKLLAEVAAARLCLLQPARKLAYDESLRQQSRTGLPPAEAPRAAALPPLMAGADRAAGRPKPRRTWLRWLAGCGAGLAIVIMGWLLFAPRQRPPADGVVVIDLPESLRAGATVRIASQPRDVPALGPVEYRCPAGEVQVEVAIPGRAEWKRTITVQSGSKHLVSLPWQTVTLGQGPAAASAGSSGRGTRPPAAGPNRPPAATPLADAKPGTRPAGVSDLPAGSPTRAKEPASRDLRDGTAPEDSPQVTAMPALPGGASAQGESGIPSGTVAGDRPAPPHDVQNPQTGARAVSPAATSPGKTPDLSSSAPLPAVPVPVLAEFDRPLAEAWMAIRANDHRRGYEQLLDLFKKDRGDLRVAFSLGLLEALVAHNWPEAEKRFALCQRMAPEHPAVLNNLALVRLRTGQEHVALRQFEALLSAHSAPPEVVQNLRRFQALAHAGQLRLAAPRLKALDELASRAAEDGTPLRPNIGFLYLPLKIPTGETVGWTQRRFYHDRWCTLCNGRGALRCPDPDCARGTVRAGAPRLLYVDPLTRTRVVQSVPVRATCRVCKGEGWIDCKQCSGGIDLSLRDAQDPLAKPLSATQ